MKSWFELHHQQTECYEETGLFQKSASPEGGSLPGDPLQKPHTSSSWPQVQAALARQNAENSHEMVKRSSCSPRLFPAGKDPPHTPWRQLLCDMSIMDLFQTQHPGHAVPKLMLVKVHMYGWGGGWHQLKTPHRSMGYWAITPPKLQLQEERWCFSPWLLIWRIPEMLQVEETSGIPSPVACSEQH